ncbi:MAG TPA: C4-type zinc ribbon domain-containing protein [Acidimicrobiales bacterium]|nr:C4-type zinc ribbon domain-containing protein [Acidimicrobiales bacterium]
MSTVPELAALLALQDLDSRIDGERYRKAHLPERAELAEVQALIAQAEAARVGVGASLGEIATRQQMAESELKATEDRIAQVNARLYGGTVTASRELQAMAGDVEGLRKRASELADRVLELMVEREPLDAAVKQVEESLASLGSRSEEVSVRLARVETEVDSGLSELLPQRKAAAEELPAQLLSSYERLRAKLGGVAVSRLTGGRCDGCHLSVPAVELDRIRHEPRGTLEYCDQCGRILVYSGN